MHSLIHKIYNMQLVKNIIDTYIQSTISQIHQGIRINQSRISGFKKGNRGKIQRERKQRRGERQRRKETK